MSSPIDGQVVSGDAADMAILRNGEVDLVVTSPPYFSEASEELLRESVQELGRLPGLRADVHDFAHSLRPVYEEVARVTRPGGVLAVQVKDLRYAGVLINLPAIHRDILESVGFVLVTRVFWPKFRRRSGALRFLRSPRVGAYRADDVEEVLVFSRGFPCPVRSAAVELSEEELQTCVSPLWPMPAPGRGRKHPFQSPAALARRMIRLFSEPGDLVVDPFAGVGTTLLAAMELGRRAVGYELDEGYAVMADAAIQAVATRHAEGCRRR